MIVVGVRSLRLVVFGLAAAVGTVVVGCGDGGDDDTAAPTAAVIDPTPTATVTEPTPTATVTEPTPTATVTEPTPAPPPPPGPVVASADGLGVVTFGDEAEGAITALTTALGAPDVDTGWADPTDPANEPLWPGCPGRMARLLQWTGSLGAVFTDWDGDLSAPGGTVATPYFAGYGLWPTSPILTVDGASAGGTLGELRAVYADRLFVSSEPDLAVDLYWFAVDGDGSPLFRTGGLRGWLYPPGFFDQNTPTQPGTPPDDTWTAAAFTAGVSCSTP